MATLSSLLEHRRDKDMHLTHPTAGDCDWKVDTADGKRKLFAAGTTTKIDPIFSVLASKRWRHRG